MELNDGYNLLNNKINLRAKITKFLQNSANISVEGIEAMMQKYHIYCIASGEMDSELKFYFYSQYVIILIFSIFN